MRQLLVGGALINLFFAARAEPYLIIIARARGVRHLIPVTCALESKDTVSIALQRILIIQAFTVFEVWYSIKGFLVSLEVY